MTTSRRVNNVILSRQLQSYFMTFRVETERGRRMKSLGGPSMNSYHKSIESTINLHFSFIGLQIKINFHEEIQWTHFPPQIGGRCGEVFVSSKNDKHSYRRIRKYLGAYSHGVSTFHAVEPEDCSTVSWQGTWDGYSEDWWASYTSRELLR